MKFIMENFDKLKGVLIQVREKVQSGQPVILAGPGQSSQAAPASAQPAPAPAPEVPAVAPPAAPAEPSPTAPAASPGAPADNKKQLQQARKALAKLAKQHLRDAKPTLNQIKKDVMDGLGVQKMKADQLLNLLMDDNLFRRLKAAFNALTDSVKRNFPALKAAFLKFLNEAKDLPELRELASQCNGLITQAENVIGHCGRIVREGKIDLRALKSLAKHGKDCGRALVGIYPAVQGCFATFRKADTKVAQVEAEPDL